MLKEATSVRADGMTSLCLTEMRKIAAENVPDDKVPKFYYV